jgi:hypothetical protein
LSLSENQVLRQVHQTGMKMTATGSAAVVSTPVVVAGGSEAALLTRAVVQGTVQAGRAVASEVARYGVKGAIRRNPVTTTEVATEATATTAAVVSGADTPVSASEAAVARRIKNTATRVVESSTSIGTKSVPHSTQVRGQYGENRKVVYHGTDSESAGSIANEGLSVRRNQLADSQPDEAGFSVTTSKDNARDFAVGKTELRNWEQNRNDLKPVVLEAYRR